MRSRALAALFTCLALHATAQKRTIDEELLSSLAQAKQEEIKARALSNLVRSNVRTLNKTTYNTVYDMVDLLITEKNKTVMTRGLVNKAADYALTYAATRYFLLKYDVYDRAKAGWASKGLSTEILNTRLARDYRDQQAGLNAVGYDPVSINGKTEYTVGVDNWLLDQMYIALAREPKLLSKGLFKKESDRIWQYDTLGGAIDYPDFWKTWGITERDRIKQLLYTFVSTLVADLTKLDEVAAAVVGVPSDWPALKTLDLNELGRTPPRGGTVGNGEVQQILRLFMGALEFYRAHVGQNTTIVRIADIIAQYVIFDPEQQDPTNRYGFTIDVEGIILSFEDKLLRSSVSPTKRSWFNLRPFFTIGLNYGYFSRFDTAFTESESLGLSQVAWAGEKIGFKWYLWDWKYTRGQQANEWYRFHGRMWRRNVRPRDPLVSNLYVSLFGSGLIYTIADLRSEHTFDSPIVGLGTGVRFFNGLEVSATYAAPVLQGATLQEDMDAGFWNVGLDIPIFEYIRAARAKRAN